MQSEIYKYQNKNDGYIEIIVGPMFSGKTEELIRRLKRAKIANQKTIIFRPKIDNRYSNHQIISHDQSTLDSISVSKPEEMLNYIIDEDILAVDEVQFFDESIVSIVDKFASNGKRVILAGLDLDYKGNPFSPVPQLMAIAEYVSKLHAICVKCGNLAFYSHRKIDSDNLVEIGEKDIYEPLCRGCFKKIY